MRLLTRAEYNNTLRDVLGDTSGPARDFPREPLAEGWDNEQGIPSDRVTPFREQLAPLLQAVVSELVQGASGKPVADSLDTLVRTFHGCRIAAGY